MESSETFISSYENHVRACLSHLNAFPHSFQTIAKTDMKTSIPSTESLIHEFFKIISKVKSRQTNKNMKFRFKVSKFKINEGSDWTMTLYKIQQYKIYSSVAYIMRTYKHIRLSILYFDNNNPRARRN